MIRLWVSLNRFDFLNLDNTYVLRLTSKAIIKLSGFLTKGKGGIIFLILLDCYGMNLDGTFFTSTVPHLEFSIQFQSNNYIYGKGYSTRQHMIYSLIQLMKEEGLGYRRISKKLTNDELKFTKI